MNSLQLTITCFCSSSYFTNPCKRRRKSKFQKTIGAQLFTGQMPLLLHLQ